MNKISIIIGILFLYSCIQTEKIEPLEEFNNYKDYCNYKYPLNYNIVINDKIIFSKNNNVIKSMDYIKYDKQKHEKLVKTNFKGFTYQYEKPEMLLKNQGIMLKHITLGYDGAIFKRTIFNNKGETIFKNIDGIISPDYKYIVNIPKPDLDAGGYYTKIISFNSIKKYTLNEYPSNLKYNFSLNSNYFACSI